MKKMFLDYLEIYEEFPVDVYLTKEKRKKRYDKICAYEKNIYNEEVSIEELLLFINENRDKIQITLSFMEKISNIIKKDIQEGGTIGLKILLSVDNKKEESLYRRFYSLSYHEFGEDSDLIDLLIVREPNYLPVLREKFKIIRRSIDFVLHELPWAVLVDYKEIPFALKELDDFKELGLKLGENLESVNAEIEEAKFYYLSWKDYLENKDKYEDFTAYLDENGYFKNIF